jgi:hypothetical protein
VVCGLYRQTERYGGGCKVFCGFYRQTDRYGDGGSGCVGNTERLTDMVRVVVGL